MLKSPFLLETKDFRILLFYPNLHMSALMPQSIGIFTAILKAQGYTLDLFDCTYYEDIDEINLGRNTTEEKLDNKQVRKHDDSEWERKGAKKKIGIKEDFLKKIRDFKPDLIICSVLESTYYLAIQLLEAVPKNEVKYKTIFGGVFATYAPEICISSKVVDYVCKGEGEEAIKEFCEKLITGDRIDNVRNFLVKGNGNIYRNNLRNGVDIDTIPIPDWDLFDKGSIYRPMQGKHNEQLVLRHKEGVFILVLCNSPSNNVIYKSETNKIFHRKIN